MYFAIKKQGFKKRWMRDAGFLWNKSRNVGSELPFHRAVNPPRLQILRIDGEGMIDDTIMQGTWCHLRKKKGEKDVVGIVTFDLIGLLATNHIIAYITMVYLSF